MQYNIKLITSRVEPYVTMSFVGAKRYIYIVLMSFDTDPKPYIYSVL